MNTCSISVLCVIENKYLFVNIKKCYTFASERVMSQAHKVPAHRSELPFFQKIISAEDVHNIQTLLIKSIQNNEKSTVIVSCNHNHWLILMQ